jgi:hypothetical protein
MGANQQSKVGQSEQPGCVVGLLRGLFQALLRMLGLRGQRGTLHKLDEKYREYVDHWVSETLARWLNQTRPEIDSKIALAVLKGEGELYPDIKQRVFETLIDAKVTFSQRSGKQYIEVEAYMAPRQVNGKLPQVLRWAAEREIGWQEIPDDVREQLIRLREPVTLGYTMPR